MSWGKPPPSTDPTSELSTCSSLGSMVPSWIGAQACLTISFDAASVRWLAADEAVSCTVAQPALSRTADETTSNIVAFET